ncbi:unnamed protein product [Pedinophyceae sp. YPF-701]|nr:unnamed protein product [Pedinophyceae sp. YPF-701]
MSRLGNLTGTRTRWWQGAAFQFGVPFVGSMLIGYVFVANVVADKLHDRDSLMTIGTRDDVEYTGDANKRQVTSLRDELEDMKRRTVANEELQNKPTPGGSRGQGWVDATAPAQIDEEAEWSTANAAVATVSRNKPGRYQ